MIYKTLYFVSLKRRGVQLKGVLGEFVPKGKIKKNKEEDILEQVC